MEKKNFCRLISSHLKYLKSKQYKHVKFNILICKTMDRPIIELESEVNSSECLYKHSRFLH